MRNRDRFPESPHAEARDETEPRSTQNTTDVFTPEQRSAVMARVKGRNTRPERIVRKTLTRLGARYRLHRKDLPGVPDVAMPGRRLAIFVHGCFWHGHDCARGARVPKANRDYWLGKVGRNRDRDARHRVALAAMGWRVETIWECELKDPAVLEARLAKVLAERTPPRKTAPAASCVLRDAPSGAPQDD